MRTNLVLIAALVCLAATTCAAQNLTITGSFGATYPNGTLFTAVNSPLSDPQIEAYVDPLNGNFPKPILSFHVSGTDPARGNASIDDPANYTVQWSMTATYKDRCSGSSSTAPNPCPSGGGFLSYIYPDDASLGGGAVFNPSVSNSSYGGTVRVTAAVYYTPNAGAGCTGSNEVGTASLEFYVAGVTQSQGQTDSAVPSGVPWFMHQIMAYESSGVGRCGPVDGEAFYGQQFFDNVGKASCGQPSWPFWGTPDGIGVMQIDRTEQPSYFGYTGNSNPYASNQAPYWNYQTNIADGANVLNGDQAEAEHVLYRAMTDMCEGNVERSTYTDGSANCDNGGGVAVSTASIYNPNLYADLNLSCRYEGSSSSPAVVATNVPFAYSPGGQPSGTLPLLDANWITAYNGFLVAALTAGGQKVAVPYVDYANGKGGWYTLYRTGSYAMKVCNTLPY